MKLISTALTFLLTCLYVFAFALSPGVPTWASTTQGTSQGTGDAGSPGASKSSEAAATISITQVTSWMDENGTLQVQGQINATHRIDKPRVSLAITRQILDSPTKIKTWSTRPNMQTAQAIDAEPTQPLPDTISANSTTEFAFNVKPQDMGLRASTPLDTWGARGLAVQLTGQTDADLTARPAPTFTTWFPNPKIDPTQLAVVLPVTVTGYQSAGLLDAKELQSATDGGSLSNVLAAARAYPDATLAIDPRVLASIDAVTQQAQPGQANPPADEQVQPTATDGFETITEWWQEFSELAAKRDIIALPWADADLVALMTQGLTDHVSEALNSRSVVTQHFPQAQDSWVWPATGSATQRALDALRERGNDHLILSDTQVPSATGYTVNAATDGTGISPNRTGASKPGYTTAVTTSVLSDALLNSNQSQSTHTAMLAALTAAITAERPFDQRSLLLTFPRTDASRAWEDSARTLDRLPWLTPRTLEATLDAQPGEHAPMVAGQTNADVAHNLSTLHKPVTQLDEFTSMFANRENVRQEFRRTALTCASVAWYDRADMGTCVSQFTQDAQTTVESLTVERGSDVLLVTGEKTTIPVTIKNSTQHTVRTKVRIQATSPQLKVDDSPLVDVPAGQVARVDIPVTGLTNADVATDLHLVATDGYTVAESTPLRVRVRVEWENIGIAAIGTALTVIFVVGLFFSVRRGRRKIPANQLEAALARANQ